jgi:hypothetical protein
MRTLARQVRRLPRHTYPLVEPEGATPSESHLTLVKRRSGALSVLVVTYRSFLVSLASALSIFSDSFSTSEFSSRSSASGSLGVS